jgi:hypothetical protein|tara:strand:+ start:1123 stop:1383 length:261 start_codon:yes stop_codon:yes gene_type:complete
MYKKLKFLTDTGKFLTKEIRDAYKSYRTSAPKGKKTADIVKDSNVTRSVAKADVKSGISQELKSKLKFEKDKTKRRSIIRGLNKLK